MNGHATKAADGYEGVHGGIGQGVRNEEGFRVLEICEAHGLVMGILGLSDHNTE